MTFLKVSPFFGTIYNMLYYTAMAVEHSRAAGGGRWVTGEILPQNEGGFEFSGFNQPVSAGKEGGPNLISSQYAPSKTIWHTPPLPSSDRQLLFAQAGLS